MTENLPNITLTSDAKDISRVILELLGRGRTIRREIFKPFLVGMSDLIDLHNKIDQRIKRQNKGVLTSFNATLVFSDGHEYEINTFEEFESHNYQQTERCICIRLNWIYLVEFSEGKTSKQEIAIVLRTHHFNYSNHTELDVLPVLAYRVEHTEVSWGYDLSQIIEKRLRQILLDEDNMLSSFRSWYKKNIHTLTMTIVFIGILLSLTTSQWNIPDLIAYQKIEGQNIKDVILKIDFLMEFLSEKEDILKYALPKMLITSFCLFTSMLLLLKILKAFDESLIYLNDAMKNNYSEARTTHKRKRLYYFFGFIFSTMTGILSAFLYDILRNNLFIG